MTATWLPGAQVHDLHPAIGNGPFGAFYGVILHVNVDEYGTPDSFWGNGNPGQVCPNFQVYKDGTIHQMLPLDWQPWCQINGNFNYAAIETAGLPSEPLTDAQLNACATIVRAYHDQMGMPLTLADAPGQRGLGTHAMGGASWGGHPCPGTIRAGQRRQILALAATSPIPEVFTVDAEAKARFDELDAKMDRYQSQLNGWLGVIVHGDKGHPNSQDAEAVHIAAVEAALAKLSVGGVDAAAIAKGIIAEYAALAAK